jgi:cell division protein FtsZ
MDEILDFGPVEDRSKGIIKVIGVGGGGCNAVRNMFNEDIKGVSLAVCNTDSKSLAPSPVPTKIMLGEGLGAGGKPEVGRSEAEKNIEDIEKLLNDGTKMVFITASMGGGTGTGSAPVVAGVAKKMGMLTIGVVTIPFYFEKKPKIIKALRGVDELRKNVDALLVINNERLCDVYSDTPISVKESFARADNILKDAVQGISELITVCSEGGIDLDFRDVETTMRDGGGAIMAMGRASGERRVEKAIMNALDSPLIYGSDISHAKRILFNIYSSDEAPIMVPEMDEIDDFFDRLNPDISVIWGISTDNTIGQDAKVTILATGMEESVTMDDELKDDAYYESLIPKLYRPIQKEPEAPTPDPDFTVEPAPEPEPSVIKEPEPLSIRERIRQWLIGIVQATVE